MEIDLDALPGPGHNVIVRLVEAGRGGPRLEAEAVQHPEGLAAPFAGNQQIDVGGRQCPGQTLEVRLVGVSLEDDGPQAGGGEGLDDLFGNPAKKYVAGSGDQPVAAKDLAQLGGRSVHKPPTEAVLDGGKWGHFTTASSFASLGGARRCFQRYQ